MSSQNFTFKSMLNGVSLPTLKEISISTLAIQLLEEDEIKNIYWKHFSAECMEGNLSDITVSKLTFLCKSLITLPDELQAKFLKCFHWVREEYFNWIYFVVWNLQLIQNMFPKKKDFIAHIMNLVKWSNGAIDKQKSVRQIFLLRNKMQVLPNECLEEMFAMASRFCLKGDLKILWKKMSDAEEDKLIINCEIRNLVTFYWICEMNKDTEEFLKFVPGYLEEHKYLEPEVNYKEPNIYALVAYIFEGDILGVKHFSKLANADIEYKVLIIKRFLKELNHNDDLKFYNREKLLKYVDKINFLLKEIEDEGILKEIFQEFSKAFLIISVLYWPWRKFFFILLKMFAGKIDKIFSYDLMTQLLEDIEMGKADLFEVKTLWKYIPSKVKISFCSYISNKQRDRDVRRFWNYMTMEVFEMFLKDEQCWDILTPYENYGILGCISSGRYDLIEFWLQKCLVTEEDIFSYYEWFIEAESIAVIKSLSLDVALDDSDDSLSDLIKFLDWAFKYEDSMNRDELLKVKDEAINDRYTIAFFVNNLCDEKKWEDLKKFMNWMVKNQSHEYEDEFVGWKQKIIEKFFFQNQFTFHNNFKNYLHAFLNFKVNDSEKIKIMMRNADLNETMICLNQLESDNAAIDCYLSFLEGYGKDIFSLKANIFLRIFNEYGEPNFTMEKYCENIRKLLYWKCGSDQEMKAKVRKLKKEIINFYCLEKILECVNGYSFSLCQYRLEDLHTKWDVAMNNILLFLFEDDIEDEEWSKMLFDLKIRVIEQVKSNNQFWKKEGFYEVMGRLVNWGKENENVRKKNWDAKKYFIECLKNNVLRNVIPKWILHWNFVSYFLEGDEARPDFEEVFRDLKELLVNNMIIEDDMIFSAKFKALKIHKRLNILPETCPMKANAGMEI